ncbi:MAG: hypothetical protein AAB519_01635 [Patescibacteria group bacterium]
MHALFSSLIFLVVTGILFFVPGFFLLRAVFGTQKTLSSLETFVLSFGLSIGLINFLMLILGKAGVLFTPLSLIIGIIASLLSVTLFASLVRFVSKKFFPSKKEGLPTEKNTFSKKQLWLFYLLLVLTFAIKVIYLSHAVLPTSTDLGHHMYWAKLITETGTLPFYAEQEIITNDAGNYELSDPKPIADFIIGEHLPFSAISIIGKSDYFSAFPVVFLFLVNILSLFALIIFTMRLASELRIPTLSQSLFSPQNLALSALFLFGPLYSLASPQAKFVSGGVVGNTFGNFFIPLILFSYYRAFTEKRPAYLALGFFFTFALAYIHHLSTLVLLFVLIASALLYILFNASTVADTFIAWWRLLFAPAPILVILFACTFFFGIALPTYIETHAVDTAIGTPTKTTRTGLSYLQITFSSGEARVALGMAGIALLLSLAKRKSYAGAFLLGWSLILLTMSLKPGWLFLDIPSNRIGTYLSFPLGVISAVALIWIFASFKKEEGSPKLFPPVLILAFFFTAFVFASGSGSFDNGQTLLPKSKGLATLQTFHAAQYLAEHNRPTDIILKDHNYITGDAWMKLFFLRDYFYPLSRGFFKRYEDNPNREQCTLLMISTPNTPKGEKCFAETGTNIVVVNPSFDGTQFEKGNKWMRIYTGDTIHIYERK